MSVNSIDGSSAYGSLISATQLQEEQMPGDGADTGSSTAKTNAIPSISTAGAPLTSSSSTTLGSRFLGFLLGLQAGGSTSTDGATIDGTTTKAANESQSASFSIQPPSPPQTASDTSSTASSGDSNATATNSRDTSVEDLMAELEGLLNSSFANSAQNSAKLTSAYGSTTSQNSSYQQTV